MVQEKYQPSPEEAPMRDIKTIADRARAIRGNRSGPHSWQGPITDALKEAGVSDVMERMKLFPQIAEEVGIKADSPVVGKPPTFHPTPEIDAKHDEALRRLGGRD